MPVFNILKEYFKTFLVVAMIVSFVSKVNMAGIFSMCRMDMSYFDSAVTTWVLHKQCLLPLATEVCSSS